MNHMDERIGAGSSEKDESACEELWTEHYDDTYGLHYYVNTITGECHWGDPVAENYDDEQEFKEHGTYDQLSDQDLHRPGDSCASTLADCEGEDVIDSEREVTASRVEDEVLLNDSCGRGSNHLGNNGLSDDGHRAGLSRVKEGELPAGYFEQHSTEIKGLVDSDRDGNSPGGEESYEQRARVSSPDHSPLRSKVDYAALWRDYYAEEESETEQYNPYSHDRDLEEGLEYPADEYDYNEDGADESYDQFQTFEPYNEESAPKTVKNRSKDVHGGGTTQDYVHMAHMYKLTRPYSDPAFLGMCVLCHTNFADMVFFPCEHRCLCSECVDKEHICSESQMESIRDGYCNCSLCASVIKLILPSEGGAEVGKYWDWVYEEPVKLPNNFLRNFKHSAAVIRAVHVRTNNSGDAVDSFENASKSCTIS
jgi:hypothetical protein